jgi:hypothetical protein
VLRVSVPEGVAPEAAAARLSVTADVGQGPIPVAAAGVEDGEVVFRLPATSGSLGVVRLEAREGGAAGRSGATIAYVPGARPEPMPDPAGTEAALGLRLSAPTSADLFDVPVRRVPSGLPLAPACLLAALLLVPVDAGLHRRTGKGGTAR